MKDFFKENNTGRKGDCHNRLDHHNRIFHCGSRRRAGNTDAGCPTRPHQHGQQDHKHYRIGFLRDERGSVIDFLITAALSFFLIFTGVDYFTPIAQYQIAEHVMHYYLERARVEGWLTASDESDLIIQVCHRGHDRAEYLSHESGRSDNHSPGAQYR